MKTAALRVLIVDDEPAQRVILSDIVGDAGHQVAVADGADAALEELRQGSFDLLLTDLRMPKKDGVELMREALRIDRGLTVILMTAFASVASAVAAMRDGAYDYLQKPFDKDELMQRVARVAERVALVRENERLRHEVDAGGYERPMLGTSAAMQMLRERIERFAGGPGHVLITGESGTGKELVARRIHACSGRSGAFVPVNCAAIPEGIAESELFGHEKGAFTHATATRAGVFEQAEHGTLFLDEISSMPLALQAKLLRVLEDGMVGRVGGGSGRRLDVRVVAATNRDLEQAVAEGEFRGDLYHRLNVLELHVPPLRERGPDIPLLADVFRDRAAARYGVLAPAIEPQLMTFLAGYACPGNVRELEHLIEKMVVLSDGEPLRLSDLPPSVARQARPDTSGAGSPSSDARGAGSPGPDAHGRGDEQRNVLDSHRPRPEDLLAQGSTSLVDVEERLLREAVRQAGGNLSDAARRLGISYKTMLYRARKFGLDRPAG